MNERPNAKLGDKYAEAEMNNYGAMAGAAKIFGENCVLSLCCCTKRLTIPTIGTDAKEMAVNTSGNF